MHATRESMISLLNWKHLKEFQVTVQTTLLELEAAVMSGFNGQTSSQDNISENSLASIFVISILKDSISCLENELTKKDRIINFLSKQWTGSKDNNISHGNDPSSCSINVYGQIC